ncbi:MAG TPA: DUF1259 domain-containing protein, partial [Gemmatimonadaceae bacterium]
MPSHHVKRVRRPGHLIGLLLITVAFGRGSAVASQTTGFTSDWSAVEQALGRKGALNSGDVIKFSFPRSDMTVSVGGVQLKPALAL